MGTKWDQVPFKVYTYWKETDKPEVRRFGIEKIVVTSFHYLNTKLQDVFPGLKNKSYTVSWKDKDDDDVTISSDNEIMIALSVQQRNLMKLYVHCKDKPQKNYKTFVDMIAAEAPTILTHDVICHVCKAPIVGFRYKCTICDDFDLCSHCEGLHPEHSMVRVPMPNIPRNKIRAAIKRSRQILNEIESQFDDKVKKIRCDHCNQWKPISYFVNGNLNLQGIPKHLNPYLGDGDVSPSTSTAKAETKRQDTVNTEAKPWETAIRRTMQILKEVAIQLDDESKELSDQITELKRRRHGNVADLSYGHRRGGDTENNLDIPLMGMELLNDRMSKFREGKKKNKSDAKKEKKPTGKQISSFFVNDNLDLQSIQKLLNAYLGDGDVSSSTSTAKAETKRQDTVNAEAKAQETVNPEATSLVNDIEMIKTDGKSDKIGVASEISTSSESKREATPEVEKEKADGWTVINKEKAPTILTHDVICHVCKAPIVGFRYKCTICDDFDLCSHCEGLHPEHSMVRVPMPNIPRNKIRAAIKRSRQILNEIESQFDDKVKKIRCDHCNQWKPISYFVNGNLNLQGIPKHLNPYLGDGDVSPSTSTAKAETKRQDTVNTEAKPWGTAIRRTMQILKEVAIQLNDESKELSDQITELKRRRHGNVADLSYGHRRGGDTENNLDIPLMGMELLNDRMSKFREGKKKNKSDAKKEKKPTGKQISSFFVNDNLDLQSIQKLLNAYLGDGDVSSSTSTAKAETKRQDTVNAEAKAQETVNPEATSLVNDIEMIKTDGKSDKIGVASEISTSSESKREATPEVEKEKADGWTVINKEKAPTILTHDVICHVCKAPIVGFRYKCTICDDFDLCSHCEGLHPEHSMVRVPMPNIPRNKIRAAIKRSRQILNEIESQFDDKVKKIRCDHCNQWKPISYFVNGNLNLQGIPKHLNPYLGDGDVSPSTSTAKAETKRQDTVNTEAKPWGTAISRTMQILKEVAIQLDDESKELSDQITELKRRRHGNVADLSYGHRRGGDTENNLDIPLMCMELLNDRMSKFREGKKKNKSDAKKEKKPTGKQISSFFVNDNLDLQGIQKLLNAYLGDGDVSPSTSTAKAESKRQDTVHTEAKLLGTAITRTRRIMKETAIQIVDAMKKLRELITELKSRSHGNVADLSYGHRRGGDTENNLDIPLMCMELLNDRMSKFREGEKKNKSDAKKQKKPNGKQISSFFVNGNLDLQGIQKLLNAYLGDGDVSPSTSTTKAETKRQDTVNAEAKAQETVNPEATSLVNDIEMIKTDGKSDKIGVTSEVSTSSESKREATPEVEKEKADGWTVINKEKEESDEEKTESKITYRKDPKNL